MTVRHYQERRIIAIFFSVIPVVIEQQTLVIHGVLFLRVVHPFYFPHVVVVVVKLNLQGTSDQQGVRKWLPFTKQPYNKGRASSWPPNCNSSRCLARFCSWHTVAQDSPYPERQQTVPHGVLHPENPAQFHGLMTLLLPEHLAPVAAYWQTFPSTRGPAQQGGSPTGSYGTVRWKIVIHGPY